MTDRLAAVAMPSGMGQSQWFSVPDAPFGTRLAFATVPEPARRREVSRALLKRLLDEEYAEPTLHQQCLACGSDAHGPVWMGAGAEREVGGRLVSISYTPELAFVAVATKGRAAFGIDAVADTAANLSATAEALRLAVVESTIHTWTRLEAIAKALGTGLRGDWQHPDTREFDLSDVVIETMFGRVAISFALR